MLQTTELKKNVKLELRKGLRYIKSDPNPGKGVLL